MFIDGKFKAMTYFTESLVEWSSRWEEVKETVIIDVDFSEEIVHG